MAFRNNITRVGDDVEEQVKALVRTDVVPNREVPPEVRKFAPPELRNEPRDMPLQLIAAAICQLTWRDAEEMGASIQQKLAADNKDLTAAIQSWAEEYAYEKERGANERNTEQVLRA
jgi:hypothetical protein